MSRILIMTQGLTDPEPAKTGTGVIRYRRDEVVGVFDPAHAGKTAGEMLGVGDDLPIVGSLDAVEADTLLMGVATAGGKLPEDWKPVIAEALRRGWEIVNGLHHFVSDIPELQAIADEHGGKIFDVRRPPPGLTTSLDEARNAECFRVHTVGHDCGVGKMLVSLELTAALKARGRKAKFVATGQTGIMIEGDGVPIDAVVSDFVSGAIEREVLAARNQEFVCVEGQGSLVHPLYSGVTLGLLHGCAPQALVMCIDPRREMVRHTNTVMPPLETVIDIYERMANVMVPCEIIGLALNTHGMEEAEANEHLQRAQEVTGLPATDVIRYGTDPLLEPILALERARASTSG